ncbi:MAG: hypothetical protein ABI590_05830 [Ilumatobacteraceae bacterium]
MNTFVRRATHADADSLRLLETESRQQLTRFRGGDRLATELPFVDDGWVARIESDKWMVFVAGFDEIQLGYLCLDIATANGVPLITTVYVTVKVRQLGLGDGLVSAAIESCRQFEAVAIDSFALPGDRETKNLFERSGLTARLIIASKKLDEG